MPVIGSTVVCDRCPESYDATREPTAEDLAYQGKRRRSDFLFKKQYGAVSVLCGGCRPPVEKKPTAKKGARR